ncbi:MAG: hypothetical protein FJZ01_16095 [Candidatus Sericytochromatia bacterium]|nr:hypothetical protein [Candidatus Tanganyikabacteria bacterium]
MRWVPSLRPSRRQSRAGRILVYVLVMHVLALFSIMPFGQPAIAAPAPAIQVQDVSDPGAVLAEEVELLAEPGDQVRAYAPESTLGSVTGSHRVFGNRHQADLDQIEAGMAQISLFVGLRACASLPAASARRVYLPPHRPYFLRAPPTGA